MQKKVLSYDHWILQESAKLKGTPFEVISSVEATKKLAEALVQKEGFSDQEKLFFYVLRESNMSIMDWNSQELNEGFLSKLSDLGKSLYDKGKEVISDVKDWAGQQIEGIPDFFKALGQGVKNLGSMIVNFFTKVFGTVFKAPVDYAKKALGSGYTELEKKTKEAAEKDGAKVKEEVPGVLAIVTGTPKALSSKGIGESFAKAMQKADSEKVEDDQLAIVEESVNHAIIAAVTEAVKAHTAEEIRQGMSLLESLDMEEDVFEGDGHGAHGHTEIPFVSTVSGFLEKLPPFSWLKKLAEYLGDKSNEFLSMLSLSYKEAGVVKNAVKFTVLGTLVGLGLEYLVKSGTKSALVYFFPPLHTALVTIGGIATAICIVHVASTVIDGLKDQVEEIDSAATSAAH
jgi:hypothetical protein